MNETIEKNIPLNEIESKNFKVNKKIYMYIWNIKYKIDNYLEKYFWGVILGYNNIMLNSRKRYGRRKMAVADKFSSFLVTIITLFILQFIILLLIYIPS